MKPRKGLIKECEELFKNGNSQAAKFIRREIFILSIDWVQNQVGAWANRKGWRETEDAARAKDLLNYCDGMLDKEVEIFLEEIRGRKRNQGEMIALMHSELSEALEGLRMGDPPDDKIPEYPSSHAELSDVAIRIFEYCEDHGIPLGDVILAKMDYNETREKRHGKKF